MKCFALLFALAATCASYGVEAVRCPPETLISGHFGFVEREWNGIFDPNRVVQDERRTASAPISAWDDSIAGVVESVRYNIGEPPASNSGGCWVDGAIEEQVLFQNGNLIFAIPEHSHAHHSFCGINIHGWGTYAAVDVYVKGGARTAFSLAISISGTETLTGPDGSFGYRVQIANSNATYADVRHAQLPFERSISGITDGTVVTYQGEVFTRAYRLTINSFHEFGYSNVVQCPLIPWHVSVASLNVSIGLNRVPNPQAPRVELVSVNDSTPLTPTVAFELDCSGCEVTWSFADQEGALGPLSSGTYEIILPSVATLQPDDYELAIRAQSQHGCDEDRAVLSMTDLGEQRVSRTVPVFILQEGSGLRSATFDLSAQVRKHQWSLPGALYDRRVVPITTPWSVAAGVNATVGASTTLERTYAGVEVSYAGFDRNGEVRGNATRQCISNNYCEEFRFDLDLFGLSGSSRLVADFSARSQSPGGGVPWILFGLGKITLTLE